KPTEVLQEAKSNPVVKQELLNNDVDIPSLGDTITPEKILKDLEPKPDSIDNLKDSPDSTKDSLKSEKSSPDQELNGETAMASALEKIHGKPDKDSIWDKIKNYSKENLYTDWFDKLHPIHKAVKAMGEDLADSVVTN